MIPQESGLCFPRKLKPGPRKAKYVDVAMIGIFLTQINRTIINELFGFCYFVFAYVPAASLNKAFRQK
ncbi:hypothetical protein BLX87_21950 [Bacillus sp. VT-16-64]|nr:hypothetical protein BLX87_21950 [Bacillus sp. VT-16-64]